ncbi:class III extradiol ring-cleavage dioxygenase [Motiliproteus sp. MSK22-1]|uniref:DODA-type extradiol aromatic ring-opening family dioxygenase n=1 Tax=Motiliproteus sp. MSK22-1 TaxID=1897630 RepID=UPI000976A609|nr:class III extradiol ring-cleavage dioxygenase [Motiliproteus sp. MSK22-1]OMH38184.1 hypothetical protein BGP75_07960 [Motiliproteus sp. MSK22-1]
MIPVLFLSHGAPSMIIEDEPAKAPLLELAATFPTPKAILCISPHWQTAGLSLSSSLRPETIHDFYGFPKALYRLQYPVNGDPQLAEDVAEHLLSQGIHASRVDRGLDHGAWTPLMLLYPEAEIPVLGMSLPAHQTVEQLFNLGETLSYLRKQGVLILTSGSGTHNLREIVAEGAGTACWAREFQHWLIKNVCDYAMDKLQSWESHAPQARFAHPTTEHLDPLWIAMGAAGETTPEVIYQGFSHGNLGLVHFRFN